MTENDSNADEAGDGGREPAYNRRTVLRGSSALAALAATGLSIEGVRAQEETPEGDLEALLEDLPDNWGRWGDDDELGALNVLGSEERFDGLQAVVRGGRKNIESFTLQVPMTGFAAPDEGLQDPLFPSRAPARRDNIDDFTNEEPGAGGIKTTDDKFVTPLFLQGTTHLDALAHPWYGDEMYNGFDEETTRTKREYFNTTTPEFDGQGGVEIRSCEDGEPVEETHGMGKADISNAAQHGIAGRGVLLDVGRHMGGNGDDIDDDRLAPGTCIELEDLQETADHQDVELRKRDILLIRTGSIPRAYETPDERDAEWDPTVEPGLCFSEELVEWVHEMEIPCIGADNIAVEKLSQEIEQDGEEKNFAIPLHGALTRDLGVYLNEILWLEDLAETANDDEIYEFLFTAAPLYVDMATGAPINPMVIKAAPEGRPSEDGRSEAISTDSDD